MVSSHVIAAALQNSDVASISNFVLKLTKSNSPTEQLAALESLVKSICSEFVNVSFPCKNQDTSDNVQQYTMEVLSMFFFYLEFKDAIREGDAMAFMFFIATSICCHCFMVQDIITFAFRLFIC